MTLHQFTPTLYHTTIGEHESVLHIRPGDTVTTTTVDAAGADDIGRHVSPPGNPMTGPFFIEGAEPGDALVVTLDDMAPIRSTGYSRTVVAGNVIDPEFVRHLPPRGEARWAIDSWGTATLAALGATGEFSQGTLGGPPEYTAGAAGLVNRLVLPAVPMLGCFGVAPAGGESISTRTAGPYGGNMDYRGFTTGVRVFLPVFVAGALFFLGDGHAGQGDGEIVGTGVEVPFRVRFTVGLRKGWRINWPRGENEAFIFTAGNARPLDQALQHATTEMLRWLAADYGLDAMAASIVLGQCVQYEIGNVFDPAYTVVCKMPKRILDGLAAA